MKKAYKKPEAEWLAFQIEEAITASIGFDNSGNGDFDPGMGGGNGYYDEPGL